MVTPSASWVHMKHTPWGLHFLVLLTAWLTMMSSCRRPNPGAVKVKGGLDRSWAFLLVLETQFSEEEGPGGNGEPPAPRVGR